MDTLWTAEYKANNIAPRHVKLVNTQLTRIGTSGKEIKMLYSGSPTRHLMQNDVLEVLTYQGVVGDDFNVYYTQQAGTVVVPQSVFNGDGTMRLVGAPSAGLTNDQTWQQFGTAIAGAIPPCLTTRATIQGYVCPLLAPPPPPQPPAITQQPQPHTVVLDCKQANFSVIATGDAPLSYQWQKNTVDIPGATQSTYAPCVKQSDHGASYRVNVGNPAGQAMSDPALLAVQ